MNQYELAHVFVEQIMIIPQDLVELLLGMGRVLIDLVI